ncbi:MAG: sigma factor [Planctomycetota bacterium]
MAEQSQPSHLSRILTHPDVIRDPQSFFDVYQAPIRKFFACLCNDGNEADEQFQEFALKFLSGAFDKFNPDKGRFRDYLKASLRNQVRRRYQKQSAEPDVVSEEILELAEDSRAIQPIDSAMEMFDAAEGEQIRQLVEAEMRDEESRGRNQFHSLLQFAIDFQVQQSEKSDQQGTRKVPVSAVIDFISEKFGETVSRDAAKQRMSRAKADFASKMITEIGTRIGETSLTAIAQSASELGLSAFVSSEIARRLEKAQK